MVKVLKHRVESEELKLLRSLHIRMQLSDQDFKNYTNLEKGSRVRKNTTSGWERIFPTIFMF
jgi:hypothetical protein